MSEILDLLFGTHVAGWKAMLQFWIWAGVALAVSLIYLRKRIR